MRASRRLSSVCLSRNGSTVLANDPLPYLREFIVFLAVAGLVVPLARRYRINPVLGFLTAGLIVGPNGAGRFVTEFPLVGHFLIADTEGVRMLAEFGVVFLLFTIGLELSLPRLWAMRKLVFGLGTAQVLMSSLVIGVIAFAFGNSLIAAMLLGLCLALSSTAIVVQLLSEKFRLSTPSGRASFGILLLQDIAVIPILFLVGALGSRAAGPLVGSDLIVSLGIAVMFILATLVAGRLVIRPLFRFVGGTQSRELFMATVLLIILGTALLAKNAGLSMALGAFLVGLLLAGTEYRHQIDADVEPFKGLLLGLFFMSVGMSLDPAVVLASAAFVVPSVFGLMMIKAAILFLLARAFNLPRPVAAETGLLLSQGGEFAFVVIATATPLGLIEADVAQFMLLVVIMTMFLTPIVAHSARLLATRMERNSVADEYMESTEKLKDHVIIAGFGRVGQIIARILEEQCIPYVAIDNDASIATHFRNLGGAVHYGDGSSTDVLAKLGADRARVFVSTLDEPIAAKRAVSATRLLWPDLIIVARACDSAETKSLTAAGATLVVPEMLEASLKIGEALLSRFDLPTETIQQIIERHRTEGV